MDHPQSSSGYGQPPGAPTADAPPPQTHQYGYGHGYDNYTYGTVTQGHHSQTPAAGYASTASGHAPTAPTVPHSVSPGPSPSQSYQPHQQRLSLSSFSGKKTSAWLKKNVSPRITEVARSSIVQGGIKELNNAYTAAKGMADNYSAKYHAQQLQQQQQYAQAQYGHAGGHASSGPTSPLEGHPQPSPGPFSSPASQSAPPWNHNRPGQVPSAPAVSPPAGQPQATSWGHHSASTGPASAPPPAQADGMLTQAATTSSASPQGQWQHGSLPVSPHVPGQPGQSSQVYPPPPPSQSSSAGLQSSVYSYGQTSSIVSPTSTAYSQTPRPLSVDRQSRPYASFSSPQADPAQPQPAWDNKQQPAAPISRKPVGGPQPAVTAAPSLGETSRLGETASARESVAPPEKTDRTVRPAEKINPVAGGYLVIDHERKQSIRVVTNSDGDRTYIREDYPGPEAKTRPIHPEPIASREEHQQAFAPIPRTYEYSAPSHVPVDHNPVPPPLFSSAPEPASPSGSGFLSKIISAVSQPAGRVQSYREIDPLYEPLALATPVSTTGPASTLRLCPRQRTVIYSTTWYHPKGLPEFGICGFCHSKYIRNSSLAHEFESVVKTKGFCRFNVPRVTKALWPEAQRLSSIVPLRDFAARRTTIPACTKKGGAVGTERVKWFGLVRGEIGMVACEACHEDEVAGTSFAGRFEPLKQVQGASERWICTVSYEHVSRCLQIYSARPDLDAAWGDFLAAAGKRMALPDCSDKLDTATGRNWYRPLRPSGDLDFCEACYLDSLALTDLGDHFAETGESWEQKLCMRVCDFQLINLSEALVVCRTKGLGIDAFLRSAAKIAASPRCSKSGGITDGRFYNFKGESAANFGVCEACHAGILAPHGVDALFATEPQLVQGTAWCAFNPNVARFGGLIDHWLEAVETGSWHAYEGWVRKYAALPTCPNFNMAADRRWYGWDDLPICPECYETVADGTPLAASFELRDTPIQGERLCAAYSDHMRGRYRDASAAGDAAGLREFNKYRMAVYAQTVPRFKIIAEMQAMQNQLALSQMMLGLSLQHADAISGWGGSSGYEYGNGSLGYHQSQYGVDSARAFDEGRATAARANGPITEASYLKDVWQAVE